MVEKLLIIEDDFITNQINKELLILSGNVSCYEIKTNGRAALDFLEKCHQNNDFPNLIFLDLYMPGFSGFDFIKEYQERYFCSYPESKLIVLTNSFVKEDILKVVRYSCVLNYLVKPLTTVILNKMISRTKKGLYTEV